MSAVLLSKFGFAPPGLNLKSLLLVGYIASVGLTVSLFVAGAAYPDAGVEAEIQSQAKLGVLCVTATQVLLQFDGSVVFVNFAWDLSGTEMTAIRHE